MNLDKSALDSFKLNFEELIANPKSRRIQPGRGSVAFEAAIFAAGRLARSMGVWAYFFLRLQLKHFLWSISIMLFMLYSRL